MKRRASADLQQQWQQAWPAALAVWSRFTRLRPPLLCLSGQEAGSHGLQDSFAMIRLQDQAVVINLAEICTLQLQDYAVEILAHEIGHHVLAPANLTDHARCLARMRAALPTLERFAPMVANLYTDLLINNHLQRSADLRMADIYRQLLPQGNESQVWNLYLRMYELLWRLRPGSLGARQIDDRQEGDAWLGARVVRVYARDWLKGAGGFAALLLPYLMNDQANADALRLLHDTQQAGAGDVPAGLIDISADESDIVHPAQDPRINDNIAQQEHNKAPDDDTATADRPAAGQQREPFELGELLRAAGLQMSDHDIAVRYYRERALPYLVQFPRRQQPPVFDPVPEGTQLWEPGEPLEAIDWFQTLQYSPVVVPGVTTLQAVWGHDSGVEPRSQALDLDLYVDCSGSMPNPQQRISFTALAGAILCLSALRAGARVQVTLWSGAREFQSTPGFTRDEQQILRVLTGYFGGGTAFPIHVLRETYLRGKSRRPTHIVVLSDDGVTTLFEQDELGNQGWDVARQALAAAGGGGTLVLNLHWDIDNTDATSRWHQDDARWLRRARDEMGWQLYRVTDWEQMVAFARDFSRRHYQQESRRDS